MTLSHWLMYIRSRNLSQRFVADVYTRCDNAAITHFDAAMCRTNSNQFKFVRNIAATKLCCSDWFVARMHVAATCRRDVLQRRVA